MMTFLLLCLILFLLVALAAEDHDGLD